MASDFHLKPADILKTITGEPDDNYAEELKHGSLAVGLYAPRGDDHQQPHRRDEVYVVVQGSGWFVNGDERHPFEAGDLLFVPAGRSHRFEQFSDDLAVWVMFYGPQGGEEP